MDTTRTGIEGNAQAVVSLRLLAIGNLGLERSDNDPFDTPNGYATLARVMLSVDDIFMNRFRIFHAGWIAYFHRIPNRSTVMRDGRKR
jgi:hypothetical protein